VYGSVDLESHYNFSKGSVYGSVDLESHYNFSNNKNLSSAKILTDLSAEYKIDNNTKISGNLKAYHDFIFDTSNCQVSPRYWR
jgi:hypothetical protein